MTSLDGEWSIAEGSLAEAPKEFDRMVPVPGLVDMASPAFADVGVKSERREAFWYRRTFRIEGKVPEVALLKTRQILFGYRIVLNGQVVGESQASFVPGLFDVRAALKGEGGENEILVRVGAWLDAVPPSFPSGADGEKAKYIPGIFDSMDLILSGTPTIVSVQAAPNVARKTVRVQAQVRNAGGARAQARVEFTVREAKSTESAGSPVNESVALEPGEQKTLDVSIPLENSHLWSPVDPFLYELEVCATDSEKGALSDSTKTRFGMREFTFDPTTGRAMLNGRPYFVRGSNVCIFRFCEDSQRGDRPWREEWVRRLHRRFKAMHWEALRYCIGFPPEMWYRIADEEGFLIQDEFPLWHGSWFPRELKTDELVREYTAWMRERWNHPCVVIWDAQNETFSDQIAPAIAQVRNQDLSGRPWDNGYEAAGAAHDSLESHPYHFCDPNFKLEMLAHAPHRPALTKNQQDQKNAVIVNEYGWLWLNRDGAPTTLTKKAYENLLGTASTASQRFHLYARYMAAETEFWRAHRQCAVLLHFCGLGYSRADGQTSDHWIDVENLEYEPEFFDAVRDAFSPVAIMIDLFDARIRAGETREVPIIVTNDLDKDWTGGIRLRLLKNDRMEKEQTVDATVPAMEQRTFTIPCAMPADTGDYRLEAALLSAKPTNETPVRSTRDFWLQSDEQRAAALGIAVGKKATASSSLENEQGKFPAESAFDDRSDTRWSSEFQDGQWLAVDLGAPMTFHRVELSWENAFAKEYAIEVSQDGKDWKEVYRMKDGKGGTEEMRFELPTAMRWVRLHGIERATPYGFSLYEMRVFER